MRFSLLGPMQVLADDGTAMEIGAPKRRTLLARLLLEPNAVVTPSQLADALWGETLPAAFTESLHAHVSRLRRELGHERLRTVPGGYRLLVAGGELDTVEFEERLNVARRAADHGEWSTAAAELRQALDLWRGPALAEFADEPFSRGAAVRLEELRLMALEERVQADLELGHHTVLVGELERLVEAHPLREQLWAQLIIALYRCGRQADALAAYRRLRAKLAEELGIDPSPRLRALEVAVLQQAEELGPPPTQRPLVRLPQPLTELLGRQAQLARGTQLLEGNRLLTLTGPGGVGKTSLGIGLARAVATRYRDGAVFVDLASVRDPGLVLTTIGQAVGGGDRPEDVIGDRQMLLVLDNFEQVLDGASEVVRLLESCVNLRVVVTSRSPLRVRGEQLLEVPPLAEEDGVALFLERGRAALLGAPSERRAVEEIVERLDGLPLAIELAAARVSVLSAEALRDRLGGRLAVLMAGPRDVPERHRSLRATIAWSYELLSPGAQSAFRQTSVFGGGFDLDGAEAVAAADLDALAELVDHSLLRRDGDRFAMLETIREFAAAEADAQAETAAARDRHLEHFVRLATGLDREQPASGKLGENAWIATCRREVQNLRIAFDWAVATGDDAAILQLFRQVGLYLLLVGAVEEGERWASAAVAAAGRLGKQQLARALALASEFPRFAGDPERAIRLKMQGLQLARELGNEVQVATFLDDAASVLAVARRFDEARNLLAESLPMRHKLLDRDPIGLSHTLVCMLEVALLEGCLEEAAELLPRLEEAERLTELYPDAAVSDAAVKTRALLRLARTDAALPQLVQVLTDALDIGYWMPMGETLDELAAMSATNDPARAATLLGMADRMRAEGHVGVWDTVQHDRVLATLREKLPDDEFRRLHALGHALTPEAMVNTVSDWHASRSID
jgi:predicted ATPase/DNA-binding SARP family transcriptional activator